MPRGYSVERHVKTPTRHRLLDEKLEEINRTLADKKREHKSSQMDSESWTHRCLRILDALESLPFAKQFKEGVKLLFPFDPKKQPRSQCSYDLGIVKRKLSKGDYIGPAFFLKEVSSSWEQIRQAAGYESPLGVLAEKMETEFFKRYQDKSLDSQLPPEQPREKRKYTISNKNAELSELELETKPSTVTQIMPKKPKKLSRNNSLQDKTQVEKKKRGRKKKALQIPTNGTLNAENGLIVRLDNPKSFPKSESDGESMSFDQEENHQEEASEDHKVENEPPKVREPSVTEIKEALAIFVKSAGPDDLRAICDIVTGHDPNLNKTNEIEVQLEDLPTQAVSELRDYLAMKGCTDLKTRIEGEVPSKANRRVSREVGDSSHTSFYSSSL
jgi:hypothetical protein